MIQSLSYKYRRHTAWFLYLVFLLQTICPYGLQAMSRRTSYVMPSNSIPSPKVLPVSSKAMIGNPEISLKKGASSLNRSLKTQQVKKANFEGGPSAPEANSFKAVGSDNLVNLFTGDFSYSIPLLDVGGYPVNLFYNGGITMEQEASWVGLGWNINPGSVSRNMRGVPDDFDGTDTLIQAQNVKPNKTWGGELGIDGEALGIKKPNLNFNLGFSYNNYLGPELDAGAGISIPIASIKTFSFDKSVSDSLGLKVTLGAKLSSRSGFSLSPSLNANLPLITNRLNAGVGLSTSYNSRAGISQLNLFSEMSYYYKEASQKEQNITRGIASSSISFSKPSYLPVIRMPMENSNYEGQIELGGGYFGFRGSGTANGYYTESRIPSDWQVQRKPLVGYMYSEKAVNNKNAVMDFNRLNDGEVTPNTPVISAPEYTYDIFTINGEGTGGAIRAYRGDLGFMKDNETVSRDKSFSLGADIAPPGHYGGNWNSVATPTRAGNWHDANNTLSQTVTFKAPQPNTKFENVYFRNPGESTVTNPDVLSRIGNDNVVRFELSGYQVNPRLDSKLEEFNKHTLSAVGTKSIPANNNLSEREKRSQVITMLTASEASNVGLEKDIRNYTQTTNDDTLTFSSIPRVGTFRKGHHISEVDVLEQNGMRYVYGIPVYNVVQKDFTFSVKNLPDQTSNLVNYSSDEATTSSPDLDDNSNMDGYVQTQQTPAYATSFLLTGLLSPDYVDLTGNGITEDDPGNAVKFNYAKSDLLYKWRTPRNNVSSNTAHFNEGLKTETKDNKGMVTYGEREAWYLSSIESKSMIAVFRTADRQDDKGVKGDMDGTADGLNNANKLLSRIDLYTKAEVREKGLDSARPVKSVIFVYDYSLCHGTPDNPTGGGKLTLKSVYFTYNGEDRNSKDQYIFNYGDSASTSDNPSYADNASDRWGTYKDVSANPAGLSNIEYPYTSTIKAKDDLFAAAWSLKKIVLPSGGQMEIQYEADDYAYTQNRRACNMFPIYGFGTTSSYTSNPALYTDAINEDNYYVYIHLDSALESSSAADLKQEIFSKYLEGINQLAFRLRVKMPAGIEPITVYSEFDDYGICPNSL